MDQNDATIAAARRGDRRAFSQLVDVYQHAVYNLAYRMLGEHCEAEDAAQEAFVRAYTRLTTYQPGRSFKTWLLAITAHHCIDRLRQRRLAWLSIEQEQAPKQALIARTPGPEDSLIRSEREERMNNLLADLPPDYRLSIILRYWYDFSYQEIAETTGSTVSAVKSRLFRARGLLADQLEQPQANPLETLYQEA